MRHLSIEQRMRRLAAADIVVCETNGMDAIASRQA